MNPRKWLPWIVVALLAPVNGWMAGVAFHHFRVRSLLRDLRAEVESYRPSSFRSTERVLDLLEKLESHGCRAIPALVDDFHPEAPVGYLEAIGQALYHIMDKLADHDCNLETRYRALNTLRPLEITWRDQPADVRRKCEAVRRWWSEKGPTYHQSWRFWSTNCGLR
jgi:hypothetical protein